MKGYMGPVFGSTVKNLSPATLPPPRSWISGNQRGCMDAKSLARLAKAPCACHGWQTLANATIIKTQTTCRILYR